MSQESRQFPVVWRFPQIPKADLEKEIYKDHVFTVMCPLKIQIYIYI